MLLVIIPSLLLGYSMACFGAGVIALHILSGRQKEKMISAGTEFATAFILGQGLLASIWLLLALKGWFSPYIVAGISLVCAVGGCIFLPRQRLADFVRQLHSTWKELRAENWAWQVLAGLTLLLVLAWATSLGRSMIGDAAAFYMVWPKIIADSHSLVLVSGFEGFSSVGLQGEMHYAALMALGSPDAAQLFSWPTIVAGAVMLLALGRQVGMSRRGQWIALAALFTSSAAIWLSGDGKTDLFAVSLGLAAYYWAMQTRQMPSRLSLLLTGLFSGFAIVAKFSYLPVMAPGIFILVTWGYMEYFTGKGKFKTILAPMAGRWLLVFLGLVVAVVPHLIKNGILYHNPIAPFGMGTLGWADQVWFGPATTRRILLSYPLALTFGDYWAQYGNLSPLALAFLPLAFLLPRPRSLLASPLVAVTFAAAAGVLAWIVIRPSVFSPRYILATLLILLLLPARAAEYVSGIEMRPRWLSVGVMISIAVTALAVGLYFQNVVFFPVTTYKYLSGHLPECGRDNQYCTAMAVINKDAAPGDRVFLASYYRYWLRPDLLQCVNNVNTPSDALNGDWLKFYQQGFRYLLLDESSHKAVIDKLNLSNPPDWLHLVELYKSGSLTVYRMDVFNLPSRPSTICRQVNPPAWDVVINK